MIWILIDVMLIIILEVVSLIKSILGRNVYYVIDIKKIE